MCLAYAWTKALVVAQTQVQASVLAWEQAQAQASELGQAVGWVLGCGRVQAPTQALVFERALGQPLGL